MSLTQRMQLLLVALAVVALLRGTTAQAECDSCAACGTGFSSNGTSVCSACTPGRFAPTTTTMHCIPCMPGTAQHSYEGAQCLMCDEGKHMDQPGATVCTDCQPGTYAATKGLFNCLPCHAGSFADGQQATACSLCPRGKHAPDQGAHECTDCPAGRFSPNNGTVACLRCPEGYIPKHPLFTECEPCPPNTYTTPDTDATECLPCTDTTPHPPHGRQCYDFFASLACPVCEVCEVCDDCEETFGEALKDCQDALKSTASGRSGACDTDSMPVVAVTLVLCVVVAAIVGFAIVVWRDIQSGSMVYRWNRFPRAPGSGERISQHADDTGIDPLSMSSTAAAASAGAIVTHTRVVARTDTGLSGVSAATSTAQGDQARGPAPGGTLLDKFKALGARPKPTQQAVSEERSSLMLRQGQDGDGTAGK